MENEAYRIEAQVECNFAKIDDSPQLMQIINSEALNVRSWSGAYFSSSSYQFFLSGNNIDGDFEYAVDGVPARAGSIGDLDLHEGDCTNGSYMKIVVEQVKVINTKLVNRV